MCAMVKRPLQLVLTGMVINLVVQSLTAVTMIAQGTMTMGQTHGFLIMAHVSLFILHNVREMWNRTRQANVEVVL